MKFEKKIVCCIIFFKIYFSEISMPRKCCVLNCKAGYDSQKDEIKIPTFRLPSVKTDAEERLKWIEVLDTVNGS